MTTTMRIASVVFSIVVPVVFLLVTQSLLRLIALSQGVDLSVVSTLFFLMAPLTGVVFIVRAVKRHAVAATVAYLVVMSIVVAYAALEWSRTAYGDGP